MKTGNFFASIPVTMKNRLFSAVRIITANHNINNL